MTKDGWFTVKTSIYTLGNVSTIDRKRQRKYLITKIGQKRKESKIDIFIKLGVINNYYTN